jgi:tRNA-dihydrouridine synthase B
MGADWVYTEFISADGLIRDAVKSLKKLDIYPWERPVSIQLFGANVEAVVEAAIATQEARPDFIDLNFGCPVRKVAAKGAGAGMLRDIPKMLEMTRKVVQAVKIPVTVKTRLGWDKQSKIIVELAEQLQDCGIAALAIHGRTRCQLYRPHADWTLVGEVKNNPRMHIPIIGNGDITSAIDAKNALDTYGVDGIMIGRAAIGNPWLFREVQTYLDHGRIPEPPTLPERLEVARRHLLQSVEWKGERTGIFEMRRHYCHYFKGTPNFKPWRMKLVTAATLDDVLAVYDAIARAAASGELEHSGREQHSG